MRMRRMEGGGWRRVEEGGGGWREEGGGWRVEGGGKEISFCLHLKSYQHINIHQYNTHQHTPIQHNTHTHTHTPENNHKQVGY
jgi:hypothetical protein